MSRSRLAGALLAVGTLVVIGVSPPDSRMALVRLALFGVGLVGAVGIVGRIAPATPAGPELFDVAPQRHADPSEIAGLRRIEFELQMALVHPFGIEWLRPLLRELAHGRLLGHRGIDMDREPEAARRALGEPLWRLVGDVERWSGDEMLVSPAEIEAGVARLEQL